MRQPTVFDQPLKVLPDNAGPRWYGNVDNRVEVVDARNHKFFVCIEVPTELFSFFREVGKIDSTVDIHLSLDEVEIKGRWLFSAYGGKYDLYDLWSYSPRSLPQFFLDPERRI
jgi:hypothetical protein